jgi:hypothetical protein
MRKSFFLILGIILIITCFSGCFWDRGYGPHDRGAYGDHDRGGGYDDRDRGGHDSDRHDDRRDLDDHR